MKVLVVDDEKMLNGVIVQVLGGAGIDADAAYDGETAVDLALTGNYDVIVLDIMLPKLNGIEVLKTLRQKRLSTPIMMLSAKSEVSDKIEGLTSGADDYLAKPFNSGELVARVFALGRRKEQFVGDNITLGGLTLDKLSHEVKGNGTSIKLTKKEYMILEMLMLSGKIVTKEAITDKIWGYESEAEYNNVEVYISFLRKKISGVCSDVAITSVRGVGYKIGVAE